MILRLLRADISPAAGAALLARLRDDVLVRAQSVEGMVGFTCGFRHDAGRMRFLALSSWADLTSVARASGGRLDRPILPDEVTDLLSRPVTDHYELVDDVDPVPHGVVTLDGSLLGVINADVRDNSESMVHDMIRSVRPELDVAGVVGLHVGRRVTGSTTELIVLALWRDRRSLRRFAETRPRGMIDPAFLGQLARWSFETYDCITPARILVPDSGPAVLVADGQRRYVDVSPGVESVVGVPGEFLLRRTVDELTPPENRDAVATAWESFLAEGTQEGTYTLLRPDGVRLVVRFRAAANQPEPGLYATVLERPDQPGDSRPVADIVREAFPAAAAA
jgi:PAS domain-containing protein